jgi:hypothetical protein
MTTSAFLNLNRGQILRVFHSGLYSEGAQVISADDEALGRKPDEIEVGSLNRLLQYWRDFGEEVEWCSGKSHLHELLRHRSRTN